MCRDCRADPRAKPILQRYEDILREARETGVTLSVELLNPGETRNGLKRLNRTPPQHQALVRRWQQTRLELNRFHQAWVAEQGATDDAKPD